MACDTEYEKGKRPQIQAPPILVVETPGAFTFSGIAIESGGKTALVTTWNSNSSFSFLYRANLETGGLTKIIERRAIPRLSGIAIESDGTSVLATTISDRAGEIGDDELVRVDITTGKVTVIATGFFFGSEALGMAIEKGGEAALVYDNKICQLIRVRLSDGAKTSAFTFDPCSEPNAFSPITSLVIEPSGQTALALQISGYLWRVNLLTGEKGLISDFGVFGTYSMYGLALEPSGTTVIVTGESFGSAPLSGGGGLLRVDLATGQAVRLSEISGRGVAVEEGGKTALMAASRGIWRAKLVP